MITASEIEKLHSQLDTLQKKDSEIDGGINALFQQLSEFGIKTTEDAEQYLNNIRKKRKKLSGKLKEKIVTLKKLLG